MKGALCTNWPRSGLYPVTSLQQYASIPFARKFGAETPLGVFVTERAGAAVCIVCAATYDKRRRSWSGGRYFSAAGYSTRNMDKCRCCSAIACHPPRLTDDPLLLLFESFLLGKYPPEQNRGLHLYQEGGNMKWSTRNAYVSSRYHAPRRTTHPYYFRGSVNLVDPVDVGSRFCLFGNTRSCIWDLGWGKETRTHP